MPDPRDMLPLLDKIQPTAIQPTAIQPTATASASAPPMDLKDLFGGGPVPADFEAEMAKMMGSMDAAGVQVPETEEGLQQMIREMVGPEADGEIAKILGGAGPKPTK